MESLARKYWKDKDKIAKLTSYGSYLDCEYITARYPDNESHIVGDLAEYVYDLEQEIEKCNDEWREICDGKLETINRLIEEKHELQQSQNQTAIAELKKVKEYNSKLVYSSSLIDKFIDKQIKELKGE